MEGECLSCCVCVSGIENLPCELQRNFQLMRELDQRTEGGCRALGVVLRAWGHVSERVPGLCNQMESLVLLRFFVITLVPSLQLKCLLPSL